MNEYEALGRQLREFLSGLLGQPAGPGGGGGPAGGGGQAAQDWGPRIELAGLDDLYDGDHDVKPYTVPAGGIDNLGLSSRDTFEIPGRGEYRVDFDGYFRVARDHPTDDNWAEAAVFVNLADMKLTGTHTDLGRINVRLNQDRVSPGQTFGPGEASAPAACRIGAAVEFELEDQNMTVFNKEPVLLMNDAIEAIPPVEDPNGLARIFRLPLYDKANPDGQPVAYLNRLQYTVGNYITETQARSFQAI
jgi:hypothetical protein